MGTIFGNNVIYYVDMRLKFFLTFYKIKLNLKILNIEKCFFVVDSFIFTLSMFGAKVHLNGNAF